MNGETREESLDKLMGMLAAGSCSDHDGDGVCDVCGRGQPTTIETHVIGDGRDCQPAHESFAEDQSQGGKTRIRVLQAVCDDYRAENARLDQQIVDRDTTIMLQGEDVERLRADLNRANAEKRAMARVVEAAWNFDKAVAEFGFIPVALDGSYQPLHDALYELDKAQQP